MSYTIERIAQLINAKRVGNSETQVNWLLTDSRLLSFPEETLFFALTTKKDNGAKYIPGLYSRGVRNFVIQTANQKEGSPTLINFDNYPESNFLIVNDSLKALQKLAELHRRSFNIPVIGITGSNGKTTVKEWLHQLLSPDRIIVKSPRSYNSQIGVPLSVWQLNEEAELGIFEAGISEVGEMRNLHSIIQPSIGIFTSLGSAHQENFFSLQEKCSEKLSLFKNCDVIIYNGDDEMITSCVSRSLLSVREIAWSRHDKDKPLYIRLVDKKENYTTVSYQYLGMVNSYKIPFVDDASIENSINCLAACLYLMIPQETISRRMENLVPVSMRLEEKQGKNNCILIDDTYNLDILSLELALKSMEHRSKDNSLKKTVILSDILETGQNVNMLYRNVAQMLHKYEVNKLIGVGSEISLAASRFDMEKHFFPDTRALIKSGLLSKCKDEIILVKGARTFKFEEIIERLEVKLHETVLRVNLTALINNLEYFRSKLKPSVKTICMVKASAYGAGAVEVSKAFEKKQVDYLGVATTEEGIELRKAGIKTPIIVMTPEIFTLKALFENKLEPEIYNFRILNAVIKEAKKEGITNYPIHVKIDTGMHRLGFDAEDVPELINVLQHQNTVIPRSVFSHLAASDEEQFDEFTYEQVKTFDEISSEFQRAFSHRILRHVSNSAGVERFASEAGFDMVRLGIGLYGINPKDNSILHNVSTLETTIVQLRNLKPGETVGYGRSGKIDKDTRVAVLRIGYADGVNRHLGNGKFYCMVNGKKAPYVGNICMDLCMVDVTGIECNEGDKAVIFGNELPVTFVADQLGTISYEVLTNVSSRVKRVYFKD